MKRTHITITGNIGVGKSTLLQQLTLSPRFKAIFGNQLITPYYEDFNKSVLHSYYSNPKRYAFLAQIEFLNDRKERLFNLLNTEGVVLEDRFIFEDYYIFGKAQKILSHMSEEEFNVYTRTWKLYIENIPYPDLVVYLNGSVDTCMKRLKKRNRSQERSIDDKYLILLDELYSSFMSSYTLAPIVTIDANQDLPLAQYCDHVVDEIENALASSAR